MLAMVTIEPRCAPTRLLLQHPGDHVACTREEGAGEVHRDDSVPLLDRAWWAAPPPATPAALTTPSIRPNRVDGRRDHVGHRGLVGDVERLDVGAAGRCRSRIAVPPWAVDQHRRWPGRSRRRPGDDDYLVFERSHVQNDRKCSTVQSCRTSGTGSAIEPSPRSGAAPDRHSRAHPRRRRSGRAPVRAASGVDGRRRRAGRVSRAAASTTSSPIGTRWSTPCSAHRRPVRGEQRGVGAPSAHARRPGRPRPPSSSASTCATSRSPSAAGATRTRLFATLLTAHVDGLGDASGSSSGCRCLADARSRGEIRPGLDHRRSPSGSSASCCRSPSCRRRVIDLDDPDAVRAFRARPHRARTRTGG